jgi:serine/threonine protein phosphatase PrpC
MKIGYGSVGKRGVSNEDSTLVLRSEAMYESQKTEAALLVVADGVRGYPGGADASHQVTTEIVGNIGRIIFEEDGNNVSDQEVANRFEEVIKHVNRRIYDKGKKDPQYRGMSTTVTAALVLGPIVHIGHVGDSRAYIINKEGIRQITKDHSSVQEMVDRGEIREDEVRMHPKKTEITRAVGFSEDIVVDTYTEYILRDDVLLLCSDGLTDVVHDQEIYEVVRGYDNPQDICDMLIQISHRDGGSSSVSVIVAQFNELPKKKMLKLMK